MRSNGGVDPPESHHTRLNRNTVNRYLRLSRRCIAEICERESGFVGEVEVDEPYFGARRMRGKPGRGAGGKTPVFGIFESGGRVYTQVVPDCSKPRLQALIRGRVSLASVIHGDGRAGYDAWTSATRSTFACGTARTSSPRASATSTASSRFGATPSQGC
jgi:transposase-like protein